MTRVALLAVAVLAGCGVSAAHRPDGRRPAKLPQATEASSAPIAVVAAFAEAYINWSADTVARDMSELAARSIGQARAATQLAAAETAADYQLKADGIANSGTVEAVARLPGRADQYIVVTREQTTATDTTAYQGLQPAWHVAIATVSQVAPRGWVISGWQPQS